MAIDGKYGKVTLEHGTIGEAEPVVVFRAQDSMLPLMLAYYRSLCESQGSPQRHLDLIETSRTGVLAWQAEHSAQVPDSESSRAWME